MQPTESPTNKFTYSGIVETVGEEQSFKGGFRKRVLVCKTQSGQYTDYAVFEAAKDTADRAAKLRPGDAVRVSFRPSGRAWNDTKTGSTRWFGSLAAYRIEPASPSGVREDPPAAPTPSVPEPPAAAASSETYEEDLPF